MKPAATILLPVRNGERWIDECMESLAWQSRDDFEIVVIDDGCDDQTIPKILAWELPGLRVVQGPQRGLAEALALGVRVAMGPIVIRQDQDDVSLPERVERQIAFLEANPACVAVGSAAIVIDEVGGVVGRLDPPRLDRAIRLRMTVECPFIHPSMAMKTSAVLAAGNYWSPNRQPFAEDFHLWSRLAKQGTVANLGVALIKYRLTTTGVSRSSWGPVVVSARTIAADNMQEWLGKPLSERQRALVEMFHGRPRRIRASEAVVLLALLARARLRGGLRRLPRGLPLSVFARPLAWIVREPKLRQQG